MDEKFYKWHKIKSKINRLDSSNIYFKERDIWWGYLGENIGDEQNGKGELFLRPILIIKKLSRSSCLVVPLTTQIKLGNYYFPLLSESNIIRIASLAQIRRIDSKRLNRKFDSISPQESTFIKEKVIEMFR